MSMDEEEDEEEAQHPLHRGGGPGKMGSGDLLSPAIMGDMDPSGAMIHRQELDDQERLDLEEEARERELSGQGFGGAQTAGQAAAVQPGELPFIHISHLFSFLPRKI